MPLGKRPSSVATLAIMSALIQVDEVDPLWVTISTSSVGCQPWAWPAETDAAIIDAAIATVRIAR
jgi:hypothetical protein